MAEYYGLNSIALSGDYFKVNFKDVIRDLYVIYYDLGNGINEIDKSEVSIYNNFDGNSVYFNFPTNAKRVIRFDPGYGANKKYSIESIEVSENEKITLYDAEILYKLIKPLHDIKNIYLENNALYIEVLGEDPQVEIDLAKIL